MMKRFLAAIGHLLSPPDPKTRMSASEALAVARAYLESIGDELREPIYVSFSVEGRPKTVTWLVRDNAAQRGGNVYIRIDDATGSVLEYNVPGATRTT